MISQFTVPYSFVPPEVNPAVLIIGSLGLGRDFAIRTVSMETGISRVFLFSKAGKFIFSCYIINFFLAKKFARDVLLRPVANIPQYDSRAR